MGATLCLHCGGKACSREELDMVPLPAKTDTYQPVSHYDLINKVTTIAQDIMTGFTMTGEQYGIVKEGQRMFAVLQFADPCVSNMGLALALRNSYDKSMRIGFACGASVFCCDNLALSGDIVVMHKHTRLVWDVLEDKIISTCYRAMQNFKQIVLDAQGLANKYMSIDDGFAHLGRLYGRGLISPRQLSVAKDQWIKPTYEEFQERNAWSLYNAITEAFKSCSPQEIMENHVALHEHFRALDGVIDIAA